ncbi:hypothetical protein [Alkalilimnicola ehrlichii]|uniref:hypothetical protein n=1 Tax=Alkalilimnicola ehrlichii TaxID=351052 RepID=UPI0011C077C8|nr:hypothetical protein [Alkalilimnicola ehrlichii]
MRMSPRDLHRMVLALNKAGIGQETIAHNLGLHPGTVTAWLAAQRSSGRFSGTLREESGR